jgi:DNA-binding transcriptional LysR family regulator
VAPSAAGRRLEPMARRLLDELDTSLLSISGIGERQSGHITIASIPTAVISFLPRVIKHFNSQYPLIKFRVLDRSPQEGLDCVVSGEAEFGINMIGSTETDLRFTQLLDDPYVLVCRRDHLLAKKRNVTWHDLAGHPLIRIGRPNSGNRALLDGALVEANVQLDWFYEVNNLTTSLGLVQAGLGASVLPRLATPNAPQPDIVTKPIGSPEVTRAIGIVERRKGRLSPAAKHFRDLLLADWHGGSVRENADGGREQRRTTSRTRASRPSRNSSR